MNMEEVKYQNRQEAGLILSKSLQSYANRKDAIVLALPRGGVPVAYEIAQSLNLPLDVFVVRKLGVPTHEELAFGALAHGNITVFNQHILNHLHIPQSMIDKVIAEEQEELNRREKVYRGKRPFPDLKNKVVILVDDGIATGATMQAAIKALRKCKPTSIIVAVPVAELSTYQKIATLADKIISPLQPEEFYAVGAWYEDFPQTSDAEVISLLEMSP
jgi:putative phosphoribosyl transferase